MNTGWDLYHTEFIPSWNEIWIILIGIILLNFEEKKGEKCMKHGEYTNMVCN